MSRGAPRVAGSDLSSHARPYVPWSVLSVGVALATSIVPMILALPTGVGYTPRSEIVIRGNLDFTTANGVIGGSGTPGDPYVIEGWNIVTSDVSIDVSGTTAYFTIRRVLLESSLEGTGFGIRLQNITNASVEESFIHRFSIGVEALGAEMIMRDNVLDRNAVGLKAAGLRETGATNNTFQQNLLGVDLLSDNALVSENRFTGNGKGIEIRGSNDARVIGNLFQGTSEHAIFVKPTMRIPRDVLIANNTIRDGGSGIHVRDTQLAAIRDNEVYDQLAAGVQVYEAATPSISGNRLQGNGYGIYMGSATSSTVRENVIEENRYGVFAESGGGGRLSGNHFLNNTVQAETLGPTFSLWDNGYPAGGNYWSDYAGVDFCGGANQDICPSPDGFGDRPHPLDTNDVDRYPLMTGPQDVQPPTPPHVTSARLDGTGFRDLRVAWNGSADEGRIGGTTGYRILRATAFDGPYTSLAILPVDGSSVYHYRCVACGHNPSGGTNAFLRVQSIDAAGNTANASTAATHTQPVVAGWNLLSVPLRQVDSSVAVVLQTVSFEVVRTFSAGDSNPWSTWSTDGPDDLESVVLAEGFWVRANAPGWYTVGGLVEPAPTVPLRAGWNLVGYAAFGVEDVVTSLAEVQGVAAVEGPADPSVNIYGLRRMGPTEVFLSGRAYWILIEGPGGTWLQG